MLYEQLKNVYASGKPLKYMEQKTWEAINELVEKVETLKKENKELKRQISCLEDIAYEPEEGTWGAHGQW